MFMKDCFAATFTFLIFQRGLEESNKVLSKLVTLATVITEKTLEFTETF